MLSLKIAFRYLRAKKSQTSVNVITLIAVIGVAIATMAMVLVLSIFNGFTDLAVSRLSELDPDLAIVMRNDKPIPDADSVISAVSAFDGVQSVVPVATGRAMLVGDNSRIPVVFKGVPSGYDRLSGIEKAMIAGQYAEATTDGKSAVQLSVGVANNISLYPSPESNVMLYVPRRKGRINPANPAASFRAEEVVFSGVFRIDNPDIDNDNIIIPLTVARDILDYESEATAVEVRIGEGHSETSLKRKIAAALGAEYKVLDRLEQRADSFRMISVEKWVTFMMLVCILVITLFNVISTLSLLAIEKRDNMWTLRALGATQVRVRNIFIAEGFLVTTLGGGIGIVAGVLIALLQQCFHIVRLSADASVLTIDYYPVRVELGDLFIVAAVVLSLAVITGIVARLIVRKTNKSSV